MTDYSQYRAKLKVALIYNQEFIRDEILLNPLLEGMLKLKAEMESAFSNKDQDEESQEQPIEPTLDISIIVNYEDYYREVVYDSERTIDQNDKTWNEVDDNSDTLPKILSLREHNPIYDFSMDLAIELPFKNLETTQSNLSYLFKQAKDGANYHSLFKNTDYFSFHDFRFSQRKMNVRDLNFNALESQSRKIKEYITQYSYPIREEVSLFSAKQGKKTVLIKPLTNKAYENRYYTVIFLMKEGLFSPETYSRVYSKFYFVVDIDKDRIPQLKKPAYEYGLQIEEDFDILPLCYVNLFDTNNIS
eukprot:CAMPEP_0170514900 /NCGR_PEP_ID=MMETSP0209-20121228/1415_1 /TAXON_ID=665100 ORGANISM="Litonotus pictus, Strain P1" /NCGR_SAMPLE_ID=MMETSP0209 /ASSEMBLY_ACC=CAM_ASM_000301 /LENGTH=302 /DNA_ID=CAMNT_0010799165 /DNA_START=1391 /DNA_END=2299 /DNA_ORIENTATION=+